MMLSVAWLSSVRVVKCWINFLNERNPSVHSHVSVFQTKHTHFENGETASEKLEEGRDHVKSSWPLWAGLHTCYNGKYKEQQWWKSEPISKSLPQFRLFSATREHEAGITSNRGSARHGESVPEPCTPRPSRSQSWVHQKSCIVSQRRVESLKRIKHERSSRSLSTFWKTHSQDVFSDKIEVVTR